jgi:putative ABC transport system ATP-binding protein
MITHNMKDAIKYGNRLIMMKEGRIAFDCEDGEKEKLTIEDLIKKFTETDVEADGLF